MRCAAWAMSCAQRPMRSTGSMMMWRSAHQSSDLFSINSSLRPIDRSRSRVLSSTVQVISLRGSIISPRNHVISPRSCLVSPGSCLVSPRSPVISPGSCLVSPRSPVISPRHRVSSPCRRVARSAWAWRRNSAGADPRSCRGPCDKFPQGPTTAVGDPRRPPAVIRTARSSGFISRTPIPLTLSP